MWRDFFTRRAEADAGRAVPNWPDEPGEQTQSVANEELRRFLGDEVEPVDLNASRTEIKPTTWH